MGEGSQVELRELNVRVLRLEPGDVLVAETANDADTAAVAEALRHASKEAGHEDVGIIVANRAVELRFKIFRPPVIDLGDD